MFKDVNVTVIVSDLQKSVDFYVNTLGLELKQRFEDHWAEVGNEKITIGLHPSQAKPQATESMSIGLQVDDIDEAVVILHTKGVIFMPDRIDDDFVKLAFFKDPDGNPLYLCQFANA